MSILYRETAYNREGRADQSPTRALFITKGTQPSNEWVLAAPIQGLYIKSSVYGRL